MWQLFIVTFFDWQEIQFDHVWWSLIHFGQIWSKKIQNKTVIFILFVNVTTFYSIILWSNRNWGKWQTRQDKTTWQMARSLSKQALLKLKNRVADCSGIKLPDTHWENQHFIAISSICYRSPCSNPSFHDMKKNEGNKRD